MSTGVIFKKEINLSHVVSFFGTVFMVGTVWATHQADIKYLRRDVDNLISEQKIQDQTVFALATNEAVLASVVRELQNHAKNSPNP